MSEAQLKQLFSDSNLDTTRTAINNPAQGSTSLDATAAVDAPQRQEDPCSLQYYFDEFFMCYTPKSQLRNWYRYGEKKDCGERWRDFKWCMSTRMTDEETAQSMLSRRKEEMDLKVHQGPNSEDVWDIRQAPLQEPWQKSSDHEDLSIS